MMGAMNDTLWADRWHVAVVAEVGHLFLGMLTAKVAYLPVGLIDG